MIAQIKKGEKLVAEILVAGTRISTKIVANIPRLDSHIRYLLDSRFTIGDPQGFVDLISSKIGESGDPVSFVILSTFGNSFEFSIDILNPPKFETPEPKEGVVF